MVVVVSSDVIKVRSSPCLSGMGNVETERLGVCSFVGGPPIPVATISQSAQRISLQGGTWGEPRGEDDCVLHSVCRLLGF